MADASSLIHLCNLDALVLVPQELCDMRVMVRTVRWSRGGLRSTVTLLLFCVVIVAMAQDLFHGRDDLRHCVPVGQLAVMQDSQGETGEGGGLPLSTITAPVPSGLFSSGDWGGWRALTARSSSWAL